jgi:hypothetical protein
MLPPARRVAGWGERAGARPAKRVRRPVSRVLSPALRRMDGHSSGTPVAGRLARPTRTAAWKPACRPKPDMPSLLGLAPGGVCRAVPVAGNAVRSYRTLSPLLADAEARAGGLLSVALSLGSPPPGVTRHRVSMEPGLSSPRRVSPARRAAIRPSDPAPMWRRGGAGSRNSVCMLKDPLPIPPPQAGEGTQTNGRNIRLRSLSL